MARRGYIRQNIAAAIAASTLLIGSTADAQTTYPNIERARAALSEAATA